MKAFLNADFLLQTETARVLYHQYAEDLPILDYHCHIDPDQIARDHHFENITRAWLGGDHYKWRLMRANGVAERYITGDAPDREKFQAFAEALPKAAGNPLFHWTHLELRRYFGYDGVLSAKTAEEVWTLCNERLQTLSVRELIRHAKVEVIVTTDDPCDSLEAHSQLRADAAAPARVLPGWRPDRAMGLQKPGFRDYLAALSKAAGTPVTDFESLKLALSKRLDFFQAAGCAVSDHGLDFVPFAPGREADAKAAIKTALEGGIPSERELEAYQFELLRFLGGEYARRGFVMQLHYGALRNTNTRMFPLLGPDTGYDCIGTGGDPRKIAGFLDSLDREGALPKTILYSLNPNDNAMLASLAGCFQQELPGKLQHGAAWWFNDTKTGMEDQLKTLANLSLLGNFVGMLTDSRSFLSYTRHEYFRRVLCNLLGDWAEQGELPGDFSLLGGIVRDISHANAKRYFGW